MKPTTTAPGGERVDLGERRRLDLRVARSTPPSTAAASSVQLHVLEQLVAVVAALAGAALQVDRCAELEKFGRDIGCQGDPRLVGKGFLQHTDTEWHPTLRVLGVFGIALRRGNASSGFGWPRSASDDDTTVSRRPLNVGDLSEKLGPRSSELVGIYSKDRCTRSAKKFCAPMSRECHSSGSITASPPRCITVARWPTRAARRCTGFAAATARRSGDRSIIEVNSIIATHGDTHTLERNRERYTPPLNNRTLFKRDANLCMYCGLQFRATRAHTRPHHADQPRRPRRLDQRRDGLSPLQQSQGRPHARRRRDCSSSPCRSRRPMPSTSI